MKYNRLCISLTSNTVITQYAPKLVPREPVFLRILHSHNYVSDEKQKQWISHYKINEKSNRFLMKQCYVTSAHFLLRIT